MTNDDDHRGLHSHIAFHVPDEDWPDFRRMLPRWLALVLGNKPARGVLKRRTFFGWEEDEYLWTGLRGLLRYFLKGIDPSHARTWRVKMEKLKPQGEIIGKRCGRSESLNPAKLTWTSYSFTRWPGISVAGQELRNLHLLRYAMPHALPDEPRDSRSVTVDRHSVGQPVTVPAEPQGNGKRLKRPTA